MKKLVIAIAAIISLAGCKKEKMEKPVTPQPEPVFTKKMTKAVHQFQNGTSAVETFQYDAQGRMQQYTDDDYGYVFDYSVPGKLFVTEKLISTGQLRYNYDCDLNAKGNVVKMTLTKPDGSLYSTSRFSYNSDDYMVQLQVNGSNWGYSSEFEIKDGNVISATDPATGNKRVYTYDKNLVNSDVWAHAGKLPGNMFGKKNKNLFIEFKETNAAGTLTHHWKYTYTLTSEGYLSKKHIDNLLQNRFTDITYNFE